MILVEYILATLFFENSKSLSRDIFTTNLPLLVESVLNVISDTFPTFNPFMLTLLALLRP